MGDFFAWLGCSIGTALLFQFVVALTLIRVYTKRTMRALQQHMLSLENPRDTPQEFVNGISQEGIARFQRRWKLAKDASWLLAAVAWAFYWF